jgi:hypothetical protein
MRPHPLFRHPCVIVLNPITNYANKPMPPHPDETYAQPTVSQHLVKLLDATYYALGCHSRFPVRNILFMSTFQSRQYFLTISLCIDDYLPVITPVTTSTALLIKPMIFTVTFLLFLNVHTQLKSQKSMYPDLRSIHVVIVAVFPMI